MIMTTITEDFEQSFNELKDGLKDKYTAILYSYIDQTKLSVAEKLNAIAGEDFTALCEETKKIQEEVSRQTEEFRNSDEYKSKINSLAQLSSKLSKCSDDEKDEIKKEIAKALANVTTLNITIRNRLKEKREMLSKNKAIVREKSEQFKTEIEALKTQTMETLRKKIAECIINYRKELASLQKSFEKQVNVDGESPFDANSFKLNAPIFSPINVGDDSTEEKFSNDNNQKDESTSQTFIVSESDDNISN